jgi:copper transporter 1
MDGFQWSLQGGHPCINLYFSGWTLDTSGKFACAMIGVFLLALLTEGISIWRHALSRRAKTLASNSQQAPNEARMLRAYQTCIHGFHAMTGYILMLAAMTFSLELMASVIIGLVVGYLVFGGDGFNHITTNPCCAFLEDEANEFVALSASEIRRRSAMADMVNTSYAAGGDLECCGKEIPVQDLKATSMMAGAAEIIETKHPVVSSGSCEPESREREEVADE